MYLFLSIAFLSSLSISAPLEDSTTNVTKHLVAEPFVQQSVLPGQIPLAGWSIFRRQGCPNQSLLCPGNICCSYDTSCCGRNCCASGYLCTGGTPDNPCCVAITDVSNSCGSVNTNPCSTPGYVPCSGGLNFCCLPNSECYFDSFNTPRCAPLVAPSLSVSPAPIPTPTPQFISPKSTTTSTSSPSTTSASTTRTSAHTISTFHPTPTSLPAADQTTTTTTSRTIITSPPIPSQYIPWKWYVHSSNPNATCPSPGRTLATFAAVNIAVTLCSTLLCHRRITQLWSFGLFGGDESKMWLITWIIPLSLQLGANALIATLYKTTPGYAVGFQIHDLFLFWTTRPRLSWIVLAALINVGAEYDKNGHWEAAAKSSMISEFFLLWISTYYMGLTANFARENGFYTVHSTASQSAKLLYAGALMSLLSFAGTFSYLGRMIVIKHGFESKGYAYLGLLGVCTSTWLASWLFWVGYIFTAGETYCPPKLAVSGTIWSIFSILGNILGGGGA